MNIGDYELYFGQLHAHTNLSDGTGTVAQAFDHASKVANLDFLALTDHSNSFDNDGGVHMDDENAEELSSEWAEGPFRGKRDNSKGKRYFRRTLRL